MSIDGPDYGNDDCVDAPVPHKEAHQMGGASARSAKLYGVKRFATVQVGDMVITTSISEAYDLFRILTQATCLMGGKEVQALTIRAETRREL